MRHRNVVSKLRCLPSHSVDSCMHKRLKWCLTFFLCCGYWFAPLDLARRLRDLGAQKINFPVKKMRLKRQWVHQSFPCNFSLSSLPHWLVGTQHSYPSFNINVFIDTVLIALHLGHSRSLCAVWRWLLHKFNVNLCAPEPEEAFPFPFHLQQPEIVAGRRKSWGELTQADLDDPNWMHSPGRERLCWQVI